MADGYLEVPVEIIVEVVGSGPQGPTGPQGPKGDPGDMDGSVYDPQGKKKDVFAHEGKTDNPHGVTAKQVGAVAKTGDTMTGNLNIKKSVPEIIMRDGDDGRFINIFISSEKIAYLRNAKDANNRTGLLLYPEDRDVSSVLVLQKMINGSASYYNVHSTQNKPSGTYTGSGEATSISREYGVGNAIIISGKGFTTFIGINGGICVNSTTGEVTGLKQSECKYIDGVLTIATTKEAVNASGTTYYYQVL